MVVGTCKLGSHTLQAFIVLVQKLPLWRGEQTALSASVCMLIVSLLAVSLNRFSWLL